MKEYPKTCDGCAREDKGRGQAYCGAMNERPKELFCYMTAEQAEKAKKEAIVYANYRRGR
jgi:hypothetical protein